jgi:RHH-type proline utilization regulon transcriptional repressor/proline dehydrogenase/delta 1-pyrroline-5-carboxylate dehydrogenase
MIPDTTAAKPFSAPYAPDDTTLAAGLLATAHFSPAQEHRIDHTATRLIEAIRIK